MRPCNSHGIKCLKQNMLTAYCFHSYAADTVWVEQEPDGMKLQVCAVHNQSLDLWPGSALD